MVPALGSQSQTQLQLSIYSEIQPAKGYRVTPSKTKNKPVILYTNPPFNTNIKGKKDTEQKVAGPELPCF